MHGNLWSNSILWFIISSLSEVKIPSSVKTIGDSAFYNCSSLNELTIADTVKTICDAAFYGCTGLTKVTIPASVNYIGEYTFYIVNENKEYILSLIVSEGSYAEKYAQDNNIPLLVK